MMKPVLQSQSVLVNVDLPSLWLCWWQSGYAIFWGLLKKLNDFQYGQGGSGNTEHHQLAHLPTSHAVLCTLPPKPAPVKNSSINSKQTASLSSNVRRINFTSQLVQAPFPCRCYVLCQALTHTRCKFQLRLGVRAIQQGSLIVTLRV